MLITGENATTLKHQSTIEAITSITQSLNNPKEPAKKLRHSLKNLCFYSPEPNYIGPLCEILMREMEEETKCFKLTCFHLISHSQFVQTSARVPELLKKISISFMANKFTEQAPFLFRVLFFLGSKLDKCIDLLSDTIIHILSMPPKEITKVSKKGLFGKETTSPLEPLVHEVVTLLVDLPDFDNVTAKILNSEGMSKKLAGIYQILPPLFKQRLIHFLGRVAKLPDDLVKIAKPEDFTNFLTLQFLARHRTAYPEVENSILEKGGFYSEALLFAIANLGTNEPKVIERILNLKGDSFSTCISMILVKKHNPETSFAFVAKKLYVLTKHSNPTIAFSAIKILISPEIDQEWLESSFKSVLDNFNPMMRRKSFAGLANILNVMTTSDNEEAFTKHILPLIQIILQYYVDLVSEKPYESFIKGIAEKGHAKLFLAMAVQLLAALPDIDSVIYIFYAASLLENHTEPDVFNSFKVKAQEYLSNSDPSLNTVYRTLILKE